MAPPRKFDYAEAARLRADGHTLKQIASIVGVSAAAVERALNPRRWASQAASSAKWHRAHREPCKDGCGRLVWVSTRRDATGYCQTCSGLRRRTAAHGTESRYKTGCRCKECRAEAAAAKRRRREKSRQPCSHGCGRMVNTINRPQPDKPLECQSCARRRVIAELNARKATVAT